MTADTLILSRQDVTRVLRMPDCIEAVEQAFLRHARGETLSPGVLGTHVDGGGFHIKSAGLLAAGNDRPVYAAKVNANFPDNPDRFGLPTIQGVIALFDAGDGRLLALLDSIEITSMRTAAATAVAAKYLAPDAGTATICGCGEQSRSQLRALACVRSVERVLAFDLNAERALRFAGDMAAELGRDVRVISDPSEAAHDTAFWITCTSSRRWFLGRAHVAPGAFVAAVGADNPQKQ
jgi:alanine dehydrogenase